MVNLLGADDSGLSLVSTTSFAEDRGITGSLYDPLKLACGDLVHVHRMPDGKFLLAYRTIWNNAVLGAAVYSSHSTKTVPTFFTVVPTAGGALVPVVDRGGVPGEMNSVVTDPTTLTLSGGVSIGSRVFYLRNGGGYNLITTYETLNKVVQFRRAFPIPSVLLGDGTTLVQWNRGIFFDGDYLMLVGSRASDNALYIMGVPVVAPFDTSRWMFAGIGGWSRNGLDLAALQAKDGTPITSYSTVTLARSKNIFLLTTATKAGNNDVTGHVWSTRDAPFGSWTMSATNYPLGNDANGTYLGSGLRLQQSLNANPSHSVFSSTLVFSGIPFCKSVQATGLISTTWDVLPVLRLGA